VVVSLRSKSDRFPCDAIAEKFGGGGHAGAGGFSRPVGRSFSVAKLKRELKKAMKVT
jgi:nanoRNase/pAp phosphatase (c-di-AMP/oligoRNAs hydrolase)